MIAAREGTEPGLQAHSGIRPIPSSDFRRARPPFLSAARPFDGTPLVVTRAGRFTIACGVTKKFARLASAAKLGVPPAECLVFEDTEMGIQAAKAAGMAFVKILTPWERA